MSHNRAVLNHSASAGRDDTRDDARDDTRDDMRDDTRDDTRDDIKEGASKRAYRPLTHSQSSQERLSDGMKMLAGGKNAMLREKGRPAGRKENRQKGRQVGRRKKATPRQKGR